MSERKGDGNAKALAFALKDAVQWGDGSDMTFDETATTVLGTTGLFIADVKKHEPIPRTDGMECLCGWKRTGKAESYFDHIGAA